MGDIHGLNRDVKGLDSRCSGGDTWWGSRSHLRGQGSGAGWNGADSFKAYKQGRQQPRVLDRQAQTHVELGRAWDEEKEIL